MKKIYKFLLRYLGYAVKHTKNIVSLYSIIILPIEKLQKLDSI